MPAAAVKKDERFEIRMTSAEKKLIAEAARIRGMTPSEFALKIAVKVSRKTVERVKTLKFSRRDQIRMAEALMNPTRPNERLTRAFARHAKLVKSD